jgi:FHS family L-fucose permease-like MFS transporter
LFFYSVDIHGRSTGSQTLSIPYVGVAVMVLILALAFFFAYVPDIKPDDEYHLDDAPAEISQSIWSHPHFRMGVAAQFLYVAAQAGIFSFFINYMTSQVPAIPQDWNSAMTRLASHAGVLHAWLSDWFHEDASGTLAISNKGASNLASLAFVCFLIGRITGAALLKKIDAHKILALYGLTNVALTVLIFLKIGWPSVACVFLSYFFMSIMFPTIFALGIHGLGPRTKRASAYLVMAIVGGAILPKLMGYIADHTDMSRSFIVPMACFVFIAWYGFKWPDYSGAVDGQAPTDARAKAERAQS